MDLQACLAEWSWRVRVAEVYFAAAMLLMVAACQKRSEEPPDVSEVNARARLETDSIFRARKLPSRPPPVLLGKWTVVGHLTPGISAMTDTEAIAWHGRALRLTSTEAISGDEHCDEPTYRTLTGVDRDNFLGTEYKLGSLKVLASLDNIIVLEVSCAGSSWGALGARLIETEDGALAPWDGVFFELERGWDFRAAGQEPFWRLEIAKGKEMRFTQVGRADVVTPIPKPTTDPQTDAQIYHAITEANDLRVAIAPTPCTDVMSGKAFEATVTITLNGKTYSGCGGEVASH